MINLRNATKEKIEQDTGMREREGRKEGKNSEFFKTLSSSAQLTLP